MYTMLKCSNNCCTFKHIYCIFVLCFEFNSYAHHVDKNQMTHFNYQKAI